MDVHSGIQNLNGSWWDGPLRVGATIRPKVVGRSRLGGPKSKLDPTVGHCTLRSLLVKGNAQKFFATQKISSLKPLDKSLPTGVAHLSGV